MDILFEAIPLNENFPFDLSDMKLPPFDNMKGIMHWHECFEISTIIEGSGVYCVEDKTYDVQPNDIVIINNIDPHCLQVGSEGMRQFVLIFEPSMIWSGNSNNMDYDYIKLFLQSDHNFNNMISHSSEHTKELIKIIFNIKRESENKEDGWQLMVKALLLQFLTILFRYFKNMGGNKSVNRAKIFQLKQAFEYINSNYADKIHLNDIASLMNFTPQYLSSYFKKYTGINFSDYLLKIRLYHAFELIKTTDQKIVDIAESCGFNNIGYFNQVFKSNFLLPPSKIRNN